MDNTPIQSQKNNSAYFAFLYIISLISLGFMAISSGMILFQLINKFVPDPLAPSYLACFQSGAIKFAISAIIVSAPIYYIATIKINKHIAKGDLKKESQIRKWLTYLIILASVLVIIGNLIAVVYNFLDGELTLSSVLRVLVMIAISASVLSYYFIDIKKEPEEKIKINKIYFYSSAVAILIILIAAFFAAGSPSQSRKRKQDQQLLERMNKIESAISDYYSAEKKLPENLTKITGKTSLRTEEITSKDIEGIDFNKKSDTKFEFCSEFQVSNQEGSSVCFDHWLDESWRHNAGYQCIEKEVYQNKPGECAD